jgi:hypothetical protein
MTPSCQNQISVFSGNSCQEGAVEELHSDRNLATIVARQEDVSLSEKSISPAKRKRHHFLAE